MPKINDEYDIGKAFEAIENELIASMIRNMKRHKLEEIEEDKQWTMWQAEMLKSLEKYKKENQKKYKDVFKDINKQIKILISIANTEGQMSQEISILNAIKNGFKAKRVSKGAYGEFFKLNERKLEALIKATMDDMEKAETAVLRMANDQYRKVIYNAQVYANTGAGTYEKAVDMATKDMLEAGLNCIVYANGARHLLSDYADMAIRTASKRAYLQGEGLKRQEWGISTVIVNKRGNPCPKCLPFCGKVLIDDVWSGGKASDGPYPLMSKAIEYGLYHPRCKDSHTTYFPGISTADDTWTEEELEGIGLKAKRDAEWQYAQRQEKKYRRLAKNALDKADKTKYYAIADKWKEKAIESFGKTDVISAYESFVEKLRIDYEPSDHKRNFYMYAEFTDIIEDEKISAPFAYIPSLDVIKYNSKAPYLEEYDLDYVFTHEISHRMDELEYQSWDKEIFVQAIQSCAQSVLENKTEIEKWFELDGKYAENFAMSDIIDALSSGTINVPIGHGVDYWDKAGKLKAMEIFADLSSMDILGEDIDEEVLKELFEAYKEVIK